MKCYYEVLNVGRDAEEAEIKAAYKKLALKWHPDKNLENQEYAKEQFQYVQQAYEVLSDRQERAWYDKHREQILRGSNSEFEDNSLDVFAYFTISCFKGYGDDKDGFYSVYRNVFEKISEEDMEFIQEKETFCDIPQFGDSKSDYDSVVKPFYDYWMSYSTRKSYVWLDPYNIKEARDRRLVKLMEKENKKVRQKAKKERNEEVRNLVAFVRKRDKRVQAQNKLLEAKILENRKKQEEIRKQKLLERKKLHEGASQPEWAKFDNVKSELEQIEKNLAEEFGDSYGESSDSDDSDSEVNSLYCSACNKVFKTQKAFANHESSKKHKENVQKLREELLAEDELNDSPSESGEGSEDIEIDCVNINGVVLGDEADSDAGNTKKCEDESVEQGEDFALTETEADQAVESQLPNSIEEAKKKKNKKSKNVIHFENIEHEEIPLTKMDQSDDDFDFNCTKKAKKKGKRNKVSVEPKTNIEVKSPVVNEEQKETNPNRREKKQKKKDVETDQNEIDTSHCCVICKSQFPSKNKLFDHLKKTGHSVYLPTSKNASKTKKCK